MFADEKVFYIDCDFMEMCYPQTIGEKVTRFGVLEPYRNKKYTLKEINEIIAELIIRTPYISHSMWLGITAYGPMDKIHFMLSIKNYDYDNQNKEYQPEVKFMF